MIISKGFDDKDFVLMENGSDRPLELGDLVTSGRGDELYVVGGRAPHKPSSTGRIYVKAEPENNDVFAAEYFPTVFDCEWRAV